MVKHTVENSDGITDLLHKPLTINPLILFLAENFNLRPCWLDFLSCIIEKKKKYINIDCKHQ